MSFLLDSLRHLLSRDPQARRDALAAMASRVFGVDGVKLTHPSMPEPRDYDVWRFPKQGAKPPRPVAVTLTIGLGESTGHELVALTLADTQADRFAALLSAMAATPLKSGEAAAIPEGTLGRSSHTMAVLTEPWPLSAVDRPQYERVLGAELTLVVPVTPREAAWISTHGIDAYVAAMKEQHISPWADRAPGETTLA